VPAKDVLPALKDPLPPVRLVAIQVAARLKLAEAAPAVPGLLRDRETDVLRAAAQAAGELGVKPAVPALRALAFHRNHTVRLRAVVALGQLADPRAVGDLVSAAGFQASQAVMAAALLSLGQMGARAGLGPARKLRTKSSRVVRAAALWALARLEGKAAGPTSPTLCSLLLDQKQLCARDAPEKDAYVDLEALCGSGEIPRLEPLAVTAGTNLPRAPVSSDPPGYSSQPTESRSAGWREQGLGPMERGGSRNDPTAAAIRCNGRCGHLAQPGVMAFGRSVRLQQTGDGEHHCSLRSSTSSLSVGAATARRVQRPDAGETERVRGGGVGSRRRQRRAAVFTRRPCPRGRARWGARARAAPRGRGCDSSCRA
jgi:hypothetical protein